MTCAFAYEQPIIRLVQQLKFSGDTMVAPALATLMAGSLPLHDLPDAIVPLPLHWTRLWRRGFNQAQEIALPLGKQLNVAVLTNVCQRRKRTPAQAALNYRQRFYNVRDAFVAQPGVANLHIALLDDVVTTGATASALTRALLAQGCARVDIWACARTLARKRPNARLP